MLENEYLIYSLVKLTNVNVINNELQNIKDGTVNFYTFINDETLLFSNVEILECMI